MAEQLSQIYIGYKNRRLVPFRNLKTISLYNEEYRKDEGLLKRALCAVQKIGRGANGCFIIERPDLRSMWRSHLKRNHYIFEAVAEVEHDDIAVYDAFIERKLGFEPEVNVTVLDTSDAPACDLGFCDV